jgi:hypothetical protein
VTALSIALAAVTALVAAGCGGSDDGDATTTPAKGPAKLTGAERGALERDEAAIVRYCSARALALTDPSKRPTVAQQARALKAVDAIVALATESPEINVRPKVDARLYLGDLVENLEGSNCDPLILGRLEQGLAAVPAAP